MSVVLKQIQKDLAASSTPDAKAAALKFVPGAVKIYGTRMPTLNLMAKKYKSAGFIIIKH
jgi:hypothetical protein